MSDDRITQSLKKISVPLRQDELSPLFLSEDAFYWIASGGLNVFASSVKEDSSLGGRFFAAHFDEGELLFPAFAMDSVNGRNCMIADALPGTEVLRIRKSIPEIIAETGGNEWITGQFRLWIDRISSPLATGKVPYACKVIGESDLSEGKGIFSFESGDCFRPDKGLLWVTVKSGFCVICGNEEGMLMAEGSVFPLSGRLWLKCLDGASVEIARSEDIIGSPLFIKRLKEFYEFFFRSFLLAVSYRREAEMEHRKELSETERKAMNASLQELASLGKSGAASEAEISAEAFSNHFIGALEFICRDWKMKFKIPESMSPDEKGESALRLILEASSVFYRKIKLSAGWWKRESSPMMAFCKDGAPAGLLYNKIRKKYFLYNAVEGASSPLTEKEAAELGEDAYVIYPQLPSGKIGAKNLLMFSFHGLSPVFKAVFFTGMAGGIVSLLYPYLTGIIFNSVIPHAEHFQLFQMGAILFTAALSMTVFSLGRSLSVLRVKTLSDYHLQSAVVGRMMKMPLSFFKRFSTGELAQRILGVEVMREILADNVTNALFTMLFATPNLLLMFYYSWKLSLVALAFLIVFLLALCVVGAVNVRNHRNELQIEGELEGFVVQVLSGINKIRNSISEDRAFIRWASKFAEGTRWHIRSIKNGNFIIIFDSFYPALISCFFFYLVGETWRGSMDIGEYLSFSSAFTAFMSALVLFAGTIPSLMALVPLAARMKPVLETATEPDSVLKSPGELDGRVELSRVSYRYTQDSPPALRNVSFSAAPGEFVAIVGPSGAGKSTMVRLLLGFETPESGGIYYSGQDINAVSRRELRKQIGTVLQNGVLESGSIYENIAGASTITVDEAWEAARMAGCDRDIEEMPMGMHTFVTGGTVSGGQKQRMLIARALAKKPRVIIFDEATSAVDNETQAKISESLKKMNATRIVIAHRLSTIEHADRIYVLDKGELVQQGTFGELINMPGVFSRLAKRQMV